MAHWAKINEYGIVESVIVTSNEELDEGESWILDNLDGFWVKTSYNTRKGKHLLGGVPFRMNYASIGGKYDEQLDAFIQPRLEGQENFVLDGNTLSWVPAPVPEDATYAMPYGLEPDYTDGIPQISETDNAYVWISGQIPGWWLNPNVNYPKPDGEFYWNGFAKEWQSPTSEKPGANYFWNVLESDWEEIPALPEAPTE
jgi:hypothetical protein